MGFEWDESKARDNLRKHGVDFADAATVFEDEAALTIPDVVPGEDRYVTLAMKEEYDFKQGRRGPVVSTPPGKTRITIRIDEDILEWFRAQVHATGGGNYQTLINAALREHIEREREDLEETLRRVIREEIPRYDTRRKKPGE